MKINEITQPDKYKEQCRELAQVLKTECGQYLSDINYSLYNNALYRGIKHNIGALAVKYKCPINRMPTDNSLEVHEIADKWFNLHFGVKYRSNAIFATGDYGEASMYGKVFAIFPAGSYDFCYSVEYEDLFKVMSESLTSVPSDTCSSDLTRIITGILNAGEYTSDSIIKAANAESEVMVHCNEYYLIRIDNGSTILYDIMEELKKL